jgi:hypothetical protein
MKASNEVLADLSGEISELLRIRDELFPVRNPQNTQALLEAQVRYLDALQERTQTPWQPDNVLVENADFGDRPLFICGYMKSGTTLLTCLLDSHPELVVLPGDSHFMHLAHQFDCRTREEWIRYWVWRFVNPTGQRPFWLLGGNDRYIEVWRYLSYWFDQLCREGVAGLLQTAPYSYYCANAKRPSRPKLWVEKTPRNERDVQQIRQLFPEARFIHIVRDPLQNLASLKKLAGFRGGRWRTVRTAFSLWRSFLLGLQHRRRLGANRYLFVSYDKLVTHPEETMHQVAQFLHVKWQPSLLTPTVNGLPMRANSMFKDRQVTGVITEKSTKGWAGDLSIYEKMMVILLLFPLRFIQRRMI